MSHLGLPEIIHSICVKKGLRDPWEVTAVFLASMPRESRVLVFCQSQAFGTDVLRGLAALYEQGATWKPHSKTFLLPDRRVISLVTRQEDLCGEHATAAVVFGLPKGIQESDVACVFFPNEPVVYTPEGLAQEAEWVGYSCGHTAERP